MPPLTEAEDNDYEAMWGLVKKLVHARGFELFDLRTASRGTSINYVRQLVAYKLKEAGHSWGAIADFMYTSTETVRSRVRLHNLRLRELGEDEAD